VDHAVLDRIERTENLLDIRIDTVQSMAVWETDTLIQSVKAKDHAFQLANMAMSRTFYVMQRGYLAELNDYAEEGTLDLGAPWWDHHILRDLSIDEKNYCLVGDIGTMYKRSIGVIMFNKMIHDSYGLPDFYAMVREGNWTIDTMVVSGRQVSDDLNGDGIMDKEDRYGLICFCDMMPVAMIGCNVDFFTKDAEDIPHMTFYSERAVSVMEKLAALMYNPDLTYSWSRAGEGEEPAFQMYQANKALYYYGELHAVERMRSMEEPFGILPMPKYDKAQKEYAHCVNPNVAATYVIPVTNVNYAMTGYVMDALGAASKNLLTPAYYDKTLRGQISRDEESTQSLDVVFSTIKYDLGYLGDWGIGSMLYTMADSYSTDLASKVSEIESLVTDGVADMATAIEKLDD